MSRHSSVVIVGASLAGLSVARELRRRDFAGAIELIGAETHLPYDRPPLSKQVLAGTWEPGRAMLTDERELASLAVTHRLGTAATALDLDRRTVLLETGERGRPRMRANFGDRRAPVALEANAPTSVPTSSWRSRTVTQVAVVSGRLADHFVKVLPPSTER